jgi:hypothetical protein
LPDEYERVMTGINSILRKSWTISEQAEDNKEKIQALSLAKECYSMKLDLLTNATVVDDAIRFVLEHKNNNNDNKNQKEEAHIKDDAGLPHHNARADAVDGTKTTTNIVF